MLALAVIAFSSDGSHAASAAPLGAPPPTTVPIDEDSGVVEGGTSVVNPGPMPLIPEPTGCDAPALPHVVFIGTVIDRDSRSIRYQVDQIRSGDTFPFGSDRVVRGEVVIDIRYGLDVQYLNDGEQYLVGAVVHPNLGLLVSRVTEPIEHFGGDDVIGVAESDVDCPVYESGDRTLHPDGTRVEGSMLRPFFAAKVRIAGSFLVPFGLACGAIFVLASIRLTLTGAYRGITSGPRVN